MPLPPAENPWYIIQEKLGPRELWPKYVLNTLFCSKLRYGDRLILGSFFFGNGIDLKEVFDVVKLCNKSYSKKFETKVKDLYGYWEDSELTRDRRTYFDMTLRVPLTLNGDHIVIPGRGSGVTGVGFEGDFEKICETK